MKISPKQYATVLYDLIEDKNEKEISVVLRSFSELLRKNNNLSILENILEEFNSIWNKENGLIEGNVVTARAIDESSKKSIIEYIKRVTKANEVVLNEEIDKSILGGAIIKYGDKIVDNSLQGRVESLRRSLEK